MCQGDHVMPSTLMLSCGLKVGFYDSPPDWYWCRDHMSFNYGNGVWSKEWIDRFPDAYSLLPKESWDE